MKKSVVALFTVALLFLPAQAFDTRNALGVAAVTTIIALAASENEKCETTTFNTHQKGVLYTETLGSAISDRKVDVCKKYKAEPLVESNADVKIFSSLSNVEVLNNGYKVHLGKTKVAGADLMSGKKAQDIWVTTDQNGVAVESDYAPLKDQKVIRPYNTVSLTDSTFSQEVVFTGVNGDLLHVTYREFSGKLIRAPFTMNITVDLSKGNTFTVKDKTFKVHKVDNNGLTYELI